MSDCVDKYRARREARLKDRQVSREVRNDYGVKGMKWGEHNSAEEETNGSDWRKPSEDKRDVSSARAKERKAQKEFEKASSDYRTYDMRASIAKKGKEKAKQEYTALFKKYVQSMEERANAEDRLAKAKASGEKITNGKSNGNYYGNKNY